MATDNTNIQTRVQTTGVVADPLAADFKTSVVIVSLLVNLAVLVTWLTTIA